MIQEKKKKYIKNEEKKIERNNIVCVGKLCIGERIGNLKLVDMNKKSKK